MRIAKGLVLLALPAAALAADKVMKPGLYDYTVKMEMAGMPFEMPAQNFQTCVKQEDVDSGKQYQTQRDQDCKLSNMKQSAGKASFDIACKDGTTGHADYAYGDASMSGKTVMNRDGTTMTMTMSAKRISDCK